jgi:thioredoxin reductase (NADPH)
MGELMFDTIIVGGGPSGLSATLHLAFHKRSVLVIDRRTGPLFYTLTELWNLPGFVAQTGVQIQKTMKLEAEKAGAKIISGNLHPKGTSKQVGAVRYNSRGQKLGCF